MSGCASRRAPQHLRPPAAPRRDLPPLVSAFHVNIACNDTLREHGCHYGLPAEQRSSLPPHPKRRGCHTKRVKRTFWLKDPQRCSAHLRVSRRSLRCKVWNVRTENFSKGSFRFPVAYRKIQNLDKIFKHLEESAANEEFKKKKKRLRTSVFSHRIPVKGAEFCKIYSFFFF